MAPTPNWISRTTRCAQAWREPRWRLQLLPSQHSWVNARLPGIVPPAVIVMAGAGVPIAVAHGA
jgi:hypothetical protein